ncbi:MAG: thymidine phosphorylase [Bacteriovoracaceae bacterium]
MNHKTYLAEEIIHKKRDGHILTQGEIEFFISQHAEDYIPDYQMSALLMSIYFQGMNRDETFYLTRAMLNSGKKLEFEDPSVIDKHSTGGVGDKTSFIVGPIASACGVKVPMIAGRGLGHTGGTIDKIEAIPGYKTNIILNDLPTLLKKNKIFLIGQTEEIAPSDKKVYALRDVTATVESIPLIASSIMSKKIAGGAKGLVMDIKTGSGSFLKTKTRALKLAKSMMSISKQFNHHFMAIVSDMDQPLGKAIGNTNEIIESVETLKGNGPKDLTELSLSLAGAMIYLAGLSKSHKKGTDMAKEALFNGSALEQFKKLVQSQGGDTSYIDDTSKLKMASNKTYLFAPKDGYISKMKAIDFGQAIVHLGGGRAQKDDDVDLSVGINLIKQVGQKIKKNEPILEIYHHEQQQEIVSNTLDILRKAITISAKKQKLSPLIQAKEVHWAH